MLHGTANLNGETGALAFRGGWYGIKIGSRPVRELDMWERIDISHRIEFKTTPGWEGVPRFKACGETATTQPVSAPVIGSTRR